MIDSLFLNMHFSQLAQAWKSARFNSYSDVNKQDYHDKLEELFGHLSNLEFSKLDISEQKAIKQIIDFFITSLSFLNNSTINNVPYEIVECLEVAMKDWGDLHEEYIIVTSYNEYSFNPFLVVTTVYTLIKIKFNIDFDKKLVQINLPKYLVKDYLSNTVLYHELGHFIDQT